MNIRLSSNARWILAGLLLSFLLLLFPPFWYGTQYGVGFRQWHFFLDSQLSNWNRERDPQEGKVDLPLLFLELLVVGVGMGTAWYMVNAASLRSQATATDQSTQPD